jgi:hypothetical protein
MIFLVNILTNEYMNVSCEFQKLKKIVKLLIQTKYVNKNQLTDDEFIKIITKFINNIV